MGNFVPKAPFDMTEFLSKKGTPKPNRFRGYSTAAHKPAPSAAAAPEAGSDAGSDAGSGPAVDPDAPPAKS